MSKTQVIGLAERLGVEGEILKRTLDQFNIDLRVACPAIVQSFDPVAQTVVVKLAIREDTVYQGVLTRGVEIAPIADIPIYMPRAGNYVLTMPITAGDECLVIFADMCIDAWWQSGGIQNQIDKRRHDLSDAFAVIGPWSQVKVFENYSTDTAQLRDLEGTTYVEIAQEGVGNFIGEDTINVKAPTVNVVGETVNVTGTDLVNIEANEKTKIEGRVFVDHMHKNVVVGTANTGGVV